MSVSVNDGSSTISVTSLASEHRSVRALFGAWVRPSLPEVSRSRPPTLPWSRAPPSGSDDDAAPSAREPPADERRPRDLYRPGKNAVSYAGGVHGDHPARADVAQMSVALLFT